METRYTATALRLGEGQYQVMFDALLPPKPGVWAMPGELTACVVSVTAAPGGEWEAEIVRLYNKQIPAEELAARADVFKQEAIDLVAQDAR